MGLEKLKESDLLKDFQETIKDLKLSIKKSDNKFSLNKNKEEVPVSLSVKKTLDNSFPKPLKTEISWYSDEEKMWKAPGSNKKRSNYLNLYLNINRKLSNEEYNEMFKWLDVVRQWKLWNCYFISSIKNIARSDFFDVLMKSSIENRWNGSFYIYMPLWEPKWEKISITPKDLEATKIQWAIWYKILEAGFAKYLLYKNGIIHNTKTILTENLIKKIAKWRAWDSMQTILWPKSYCVKKIVATKENYNRIIEALKNFNPKKLSSISITAKQMKWKSDRCSYNVNWEVMYYNHAYSLYSIEKEWDRIVSVTLENPWNNKNRKWWWKIKLPLLSFLYSIHSISAWSTTNSFLNFTTFPNEIKIVDTIHRE